LHLLSRCSTTWAIPPPHLLVLILLVPLPYLRISSPGIPSPLEGVWSDEKVMPGIMQRIPRIFWSSH
jgi:hypothetical protein